LSEAVQESQLQSWKKGDRIPWHLKFGTEKRGVKKRKGGGEVDVALSSGRFSAEVQKAYASEKQKGGSLEEIKTNKGWGG